MKLLFSSTRRGQLAFTMVEIAISLGVIAFAMVAIIGVLPMGMNVQRENKEQTLINHDGNYLLEAIRNGAQGFDNLTNYVEWISIERTAGATTTTQVFYNINDMPAVMPPANPAGNTANSMIDGRVIIGLLSTPKFATNNVTNRVTAYVHSLSGGAMEQSKASRELSFAYLLSCEIVPFSFYPTNDILFVSGDVTPENLARSNRWWELRQLGVARPDVNSIQHDVNLRTALSEPQGANLFDVRLTFRWPAQPNGNVPPGARRQQFRMLVGGTLLQTNIGEQVFFFQPQQYVRKP